MNKEGVTIIQDSKFNEVLMSVKVLITLKKETVTLANVYTQLLGDRSIQYPTKKAMSQAMDLMYGLKFGSRSYSVGKHQVIELTLKGINEKFVDLSLHQSYLDFMKEVFMNPLINENTVKEAIKVVRQNMKRSQESPNTYAIYKAFELAGKDQSFGINMLGYEDDLNLISVADVAAFHQEILKEASTLFYMIGEVEPLAVDFSRPIDSASVTKTHIESIFEFETHNAPQSELIQVYETDIHPHHPLYYPYLIFLAILGQSASSYLFQNIREKNSLSYSIYASQLIYDSLFYISTSIAPENETIVLDLIKAQFKLIAEDTLDLNSAKQYVINRIEASSESASQSLGFEFRNHTLNLNDKPSDVVASFEKVTEAEVKAVLDHIKDPFTFVYRGQNNEEN